MHHANKTDNRRKGLSACLFALIIGLVLLGGMTGTSYAASIGCGQCHGSAPLSSNAAEQATGHRTGYESTPSTEDTKTPVKEDVCGDQGRGLHGVHMNYSSVSYGKKSTTRGNCNYCHNSHIHENNFVEFEGYAPFMAMGTIKATSNVTLGNGGTGYTVGDVCTINGGTNGAVTVATVNGSGTVLTYTVSAYRESYGYSVANGIATTGGTGTGLTVNITAITNYGLRQAVDSESLVVTGTGIGVNGLDITQMDGTATCTGACHSGTSASNPAAWGNYTSASIKLSCASCHDDSDSATMTLSGAHGKHLNTAVNTGATAMGAANDAGCVACHLDNTNDWVKLTDDFGAGKAYPHASDGTNVVSDNATLAAGISATRGSGATDTCAASCHPRSATLQWGQTMTCDSCHYQEATPSSANNTGTGALGGSHSAHFDQGKVCSDCHTVPASGDTTHASALPIVAANATITRASMSYVAGTKTCTFGSNPGDGAGCHGDGGVTPAWGNPLSIPACAICHNYPTVSGADWTGTNGHVVRYDAPAVNTHLKASGFDASGATSYATQVGAGGSCNTCHSGGTHRDGTINVNASGNGFCAPDFTVNVNATRSDVSCSNVKCHSGKTTPNWWD